VAFLRTRNSEFMENVSALLVFDKTGDPSRQIGATWMDHSPGQRRGEVDSSAKFLTRLTSQHGDHLGRNVDANQSPSEYGDRSTTLGLTATSDSPEAARNAAATDRWIHVGLRIGVEQRTRIFVGTDVTLLLQRGAPQLTPGMKLILPSRARQSVRTEKEFANSTVAIHVFALRRQPSPKGGHIRTVRVRERLRETKPLDLDVYAAPQSGHGS
jgi:hypothetical protein